MTDRVWIVTETETVYEPLIRCAFPTEAEAEAYVARVRQHGRRWLDIEDYPLYETAEQAITVEKSPS